MPETVAIAYNRNRAVYVSNPLLLFSDFQPVLDSTDQTMVSSQGERQPSFHRMIPDDLHRPLVDGADQPRFLHHPDIRVGQDLSSLGSSGLVGVDVRDIVELGRAFVVHVPTEFRELGEETSFDQGVGTEVDAGFALSAAMSKGGLGLSGMSKFQSCSCFLPKRTSDDLKVAIVFSWKVSS